MSLPLKQLEGKYEILHKIKEGGMGAVYKVRHLLLEEVRVIKVIRPQFADQADLQERFLHEARTAIRLRHPNIAQLYDFSIDTEEGTSFMVMEFIDGVTLQEMIHKSGPPGVGLSLEIAEQSLKALAYLHDQGYIHRDISPDNLMLTRGFDGEPLVKLIDLGIAKHLEGEAGLTQTGMFLGKVRYSSPEQFSRKGQQESRHDQRADLYSFGMLLYELLTGACPVTGDNVSELIAAHLFHPPLDFAESDPEGHVPAGLREVVLKTLEKSPEDRVGSAEELISALRPFKTGDEAVRRDLDQTLADTASLIVDEKDLLEPGSTQSRLNRQFIPVATPEPSALLQELSDPEIPRPAKASSTQRVEELFANAQLLARLDEVDKARHELRRLLRQAPDHSGALELLDSLDAPGTLLRNSLVAEGEADSGTFVKEDADSFHAQMEALQGRSVGVVDSLAATRVTRSDEELEAAGQSPRGAEEEARAWTRNAAQEIEAAIESGDLDRAEGELRRALERRGEITELRELGDRLQEALAAVSQEAGVEEVRPGTGAGTRRRRADSTAAAADPPAADPPAAETVLEASPGALADLSEAPLGWDAPDTEDGEPPTEPAMVGPGSRRQRAREAAGAPRRGLPVAWIAILAAVAFLVAAWMLRDRFFGDSEISGGGSSEQFAEGLSAAGAASGAELEAAAGGEPSLVLDAVPWGVVESIVDASGRGLPVPDPGTTPLALRLPPGTYRVTLSNPGHAEAQTVSVEVVAGRTLSETVNFGEVDVDAYFERAGW